MKRKESPNTTDITILISDANFQPIGCADWIKTLSTLPATGRSNKKEAKVSKMVLLMIIAFLIAWMPYAVLTFAIQYFYVSIPDDKPRRRVSLRLIN